MQELFFTAGFGPAFLCAKKSREKILVTPFVRTKEAARIWASSLSGVVPKEHVLAVWE